MATSRPLLAFALAGLIASPGWAQTPVPRAAVFTWTTLHLVMVPDSTGIYVHASMPLSARAYQSTIKPSDALDWVSDVRWFLDQKLADDDTATTRSSASLNDLEDGGRIYFVRQRVGQAWTSDRLLVFEGRDPNSAPVIVSADERTARSILDSMEIVARRAPPFHSDALVDASGAPIKYDEHVQVKPGQKMYLAPDARVRVW